jgi:hypothetical protein
MIKQMLVPMPIEGTQDTIPLIIGYEWIKKLPNKQIYFALFQRWPKQNLPSGYDYYIMSFHLEAVDLDWLKKQQVSGTIIVLHDGNNYNLNLPGVCFLSYFYWHYQLDLMYQWFGHKQKSKPSYKFSAVCNRISQSKIWVTTKLLESARPSSLIALNTWLEEKNVHGWQPTGNDTLDSLTEIFRTIYLGQVIKVDDFDNATQNSQHITGNPWQPLYTDSVIHFTNESFHYSSMQENNLSYTWPGPFITEKTLKCLLAGTAFVPVGQFDTYGVLSTLGLKFDYGFDTKWDRDPGNLSRFQSIVQLIDTLNQFDIDHLQMVTKDSNQHNQNHVISGQFGKQCQQRNNATIEKINQIII